jgi:hypothetical protein
LDYLIYYLVPTAFMMVAFVSWVLTKSVKAKTGIDVTIVLVLLFMMVAMLIGPAYLYLTTLNFTIGDVAIWEIAVFMSVGMAPLGVLLFAKFWIQGETERKAPLPLSALLEHVPELRASYIALLFASELLMGWTFNLASGLIALSAGYTVTAVGREVSYSLTTYWFVFTMVGEMALTLFAFRKAIRRNLLTVLGIQAVVMFLTPTALALQPWETYTVYLEAAVMTGVVVYAIAYLRRNEERDRALLDYLGLFIIANAVMMGGFLLWLVSGDTLLLALSLVVETVIYFDAVLTGAGLGATFRGVTVVRVRLDPQPSVPPAGLPTQSQDRPDQRVRPSSRYPSPES